ncbi:MAG: PIN domain-containing protein [Bryobacterales bacterium]|nr:PIN domain-containing protein [Bryobacterales bacterium]MDE0262422.1 PIN domain-containing protein [Bryobacterales bacterium]MDE0621515.1 PIN domain-containing protein [Bryobacterales bacterium]
MRFVDTGFWVALLVPRDRHHVEATKIWHEDQSLLLCSNHIVGETWTFLRRRAGHEVAVSFLDALDRSPRVAVVHVDPDVEEEARRWLRRHDERAYSFVDAVSFEVMRRRRLNEALTFDGDFAAAGYVEVRRS